MKIKLIIILVLEFLYSHSYGVSIYMGIQPGRSTRADVEKVFGKEMSASANVFEYSLPGVSGKIFVEYREKDQLVDRIERRFVKPISRNALLRSLGLPVNADEQGKDRNGNLIEYFGDVKTLALTYASSQSESGIVSIGYYSMELYDKSLDRARNPQVQYNPTDCREVYFWAQSQKEAAKRSRNTVRHQAILEIAILSQRGECEKANRLAQQYKEQYK